MDELILVMPAKADPERDSVAIAWERAGGSVLRLDRFWEPPPLERARVRLYGNDTFCHIVAQKLQLELVSPPDDLLVQVPAHYLRREVALLSVEMAEVQNFPRFVKPLVPKLFAARVYRDAGELAQECRGLPPETPVLTSQVVTIRAEARAFVLHGQVLSCAVYEGRGEQAEEFVAQVAGLPLLPATCVLDAALLEEGWALLEANATWGAGLNGCDPDAAIACLREATGLAEGRFMI